MRSLTIPLVFAAAVTTAGCAGMSESGRRVTTGTGAGAATGALIGSFSGDAGKGALIGGAVGATGGYLYDKNKQNEQKAYDKGYRAGQKPE